MSESECGSDAGNRGPTRTSLESALQEKGQDGPGREGSVDAVKSRSSRVSAYLLPAGRTRSVSMRFIPAFTILACV